MPFVRSGCVEGAARGWGACSRFRVRGPSGRRLGGIGRRQDAPARHLTLLLRLLFSPAWGVVGLDQLEDRFGSWG